ncbi:uncharacterized protein BDR25DRAFT_299370 [Lindgomyces ingoldianus]|uniref:Uncharacterized protein n=1 Tax=Lindgomyces ingoldianus TaxID=673940 RepID=A0ACB6RE48_9PLEO|nr:uncharacterized protein BDR25DRAFT_299370 [Lindgomyces ingoldianus]KAF2477416.1 hypothetical protein BDR25DRAFT_299370 [Lindgomyces ingoldianus]
MSKITFSLPTNLDTLLLGTSKKASFLSSSITLATSVTSSESIFFKLSALGSTWCNVKTSTHLLISFSILSTSFSFRKLAIALKLPALQESSSAGKVSSKIAFNSSTCFLQLFITCSSAIFDPGEMCTLVELHIFKSSMSKGSRILMPRNTFGTSPRACWNS